MKAKLFSIVTKIFPGVVKLLDNKDSLRVIYYHNISESNASYCFNNGISPMIFKRQLETLSKRYKIITLSEAMKIDKQNFDNHLCITFDDGFRECYDVVRPILNDLGYKATFFISEKGIDNQDMLWRNKLLTVQNLITKKNLATLIQKFYENYGIKITQNLLESSSNWKMADKDEMADFIWNEAHIGDLNEYLQEQKPYMSENQIKKMLSEGFEIGCHTYSHPYCDRLSKEEIDEEIILSAKRLSNRFSIECELFSYPFGKSVSKENEDYILANSDIKLLLGISDSLNNRPNQNHWERVGMEKKFDKSMYSFYMSSKIRSIKEN